jgi:hypothetical protein
MDSRRAAGIGEVGQQRALARPGPQPGERISDRRINGRLPSGAMSIREFTNRQCAWRS